MVIIIFLAKIGVSIALILGAVALSLGLISALFNNARLADVAYKLAKLVITFALVVVLALFVLYCILALWGFIAD